LKAFAHYLFWACPHFPVAVGLEQLHRPGSKFT
jgi:hypothetical protein